jgi:hypothetical protein
VIVAQDRLPSSVLAKRATGVAEVNPGTKENEARRLRLAAVPEANREAQREPAAGGVARNGEWAIDTIAKRSVRAED